MAAGDGPVGAQILQVKQFCKLFRISTNGIGEADLDLGFWQCHKGDRRTPVLSQVSKKNNHTSRSKKKCRHKDMANDYKEEEIAILPAPRN